MDKAKLTELIESQIADTDLFIVDIVISAASDIDVTLDSDTRVSIEQCMALSRAVDAVFDRDEHDYSLTIGSAGVGSPLKLARQFDKILGRQVELTMRGNGVKIRGELKGHDEQGVTVSCLARELVEGKKRRVEVEREEEYKFVDIKTVCESLFV